MEMMRDMYQNGDPEMKRMIAEAWTKSRDEQEAKHKHDHDHDHHDHDHDHDHHHQINNIKLRKKYLKLNNNKIYF